MVVTENGRVPSFVERDETNEDPKGKNSNNPDKWECGHSEESCYSFNIPAHAQALQTTNVRHLRGEMQSDKSNNTNAFASLESMILKNRPTTANKKRKNRHSFLNTFEEKKKATPTESSRAIPSPWSSTRTGGSGCFIPSGRSTARNGSCPKEDDPDHFNVQRDYDERLKPSESAPVKSGTNSNRTTKRPLNGSMSQFIVGSRPNHWGATSSRSDWNQDANKKSRVDDGHANRNDSYFAALSQEFHKSSATLARDNNPSATYSVETAACTTMSISFAPAFVTKSTGLRQPDNNGTVATTVEAIVDSNESPTGPAIETRTIVWQPPSIIAQPEESTSSPEEGRKSKTTDGPLMKRLLSIREKIMGDSIRLSSGQYPFSVRSINRNDPRNQAQSFCDVTLLDDPVLQNQSKNVMAARCYVHSWKTKSIVVSSLKNPNDEFAWLLLMRHTIHEKGLAKGSQLRIYNASSVQLSTPIENSGIPANPMSWIVFCSDVCEHYPSSILPTLSDVSMIWNYGSSYKKVSSRVGSQK